MSTSTVSDLLIPQSLTQPEVDSGRHCGGDMRSGVFVARLCYRTLSLHFETVMGRAFKK